jgi:hypothetical protein
MDATMDLPDERAEQHSSTHCAHSPMTTDEISS